MDEANELPARGRVDFAGFFFLADERGDAWLRTPGETKTIRFRNDGIYSGLLFFFGLFHFGLLIGLLAYGSS